MADWPARPAVKRTVQLHLLFVHHAQCVIDFKSS